MHRLDIAADGLSVVSSVDVVDILRRMEKNVEHPDADDDKDDEGRALEKDTGGARRRVNEVVSQINGHAGYQKDQALEKEALGQVSSHLLVLCTTTPSSRGTRKRRETKPAKRARSNRATKAAEKPKVWARLSEKPWEANQVSRLFSMGVSFHVDQVGLYWTQKTGEMSTSLQ